MTKSAHLPEYWPRDLIRQFCPISGDVNRIFDQAFAPELANGEILDHAVYHDKGGQLMGVDLCYASGWAVRWRKGLYGALDSVEEVGPGGEHIANERTCDLEDVELALAHGGIAVDQSSSPMAQSARFTLTAQEALAEIDAAQYD